MSLKGEKKKICFLVFEYLFIQFSSFDEQRTKRRVLRPEDNNNNIIIDEKQTNLKIN